MFEFLQEEPEASILKKGTFAGTLVATALAAGGAPGGGLAATVDVPKPATTIRRVALRGANGARREDTLYEVTVTPRDDATDPWTVSKRYTEFALLKSRLSGAAALKAFPFPDKRIMGMMGKFDDEVFNERRDTLGLWLGNVVAMRGGDPSVQEFLANPDRPIHETVGEEGSPLTVLSTKKEMEGDAREAQGWGALTDVLASIARLPSSLSALTASVSDTTGNTAPVNMTSAYYAPPPVTDSSWLETKKFLTPSLLRRADASYDTANLDPFLVRASDCYRSTEGLLSSVKVDACLFRRTPLYQPGAGEAVRCVAVNVTADAKGLRESYLLHCQPTDGFGWHVVSVARMCGCKMCAEH